MEVRLPQTMDVLLLLQLLLLLEARKGAVEIQPEALFG
jgi:hypothetical protein